MKIIEYILFAVSITSWIGLLPCIIALKTLPSSYLEQALIVFIVALLIMTISSTAFGILRDM